MRDCIKVGTSSIETNKLLLNMSGLTTVVRKGSGISTTRKYDKSLGCLEGWIAWLGYKQTVHIHARL